MAASPSPPLNGLPSGTRLGEFELRGVLGVGGFSIVYLAHDHSLQREVAVKEYMPAHICSRTSGSEIVAVAGDRQEAFSVGLRSFVNEARLLASFDHPALVKVYRFWEANGTAYMVMPRYQGRTLREYRAEQGESPDEPALRALLDALLGALDTLHAQSVYHRDIAPDNILVLESLWYPVLLDFGAARRVLADREQALTSVLKPAYAPIEQFAEAATLKQGPWSDLYALGATLHFLLRGKPPPSAPGRVVGDEMEPLAAHPLPGFSLPFLQAVDWMLTPLPKGRPQSVAELRARLQDSWVPDAAERPTAANAGAEPAIVPGQVSSTRQLPRPSLPGRGLLGRLLSWLRPTAPAPTQARPAVPPPGDGERTIIASPGVLEELQRRLDDPALRVDTTMIIPTRGAAGSAAAEVSLLVVKSDVSSMVGQRFPLAAAHLRLGRTEAADIVVADSSLSRQHAIVERGAAGLTISDLGSSNGTWVNGFRLLPHQPRALLPGAQVRLGNTVLAVTLDRDEALPQLAGSRLGGRYLLLECLHASPKGALYRARKGDSAKEVAVKLLAPAYAAWSGFRDAFSNEAEIATSMQHPHICGLDDHGEAEVDHDGTLLRLRFVAYELMTGGSLGNRLKSLPQMETEVIAAWLRDLASALEHVHRKGLVHGGLKPSAVCFDADDHVYLTDFAISRPGTAAVAMFGAPAFTAPEQWDGAAAGPAADQYALGVLTYLMFTGVRPYEGQEDPTTRDRNMQAPPSPLHVEAQRRSGRKLPPALTAVVNRALARKPEDRHASVQVFAERLAMALVHNHRALGSEPVFISYQRGEGSAWVNMIAREIDQALGARCFVDTTAIDRAEQFPRRIREAVQHCEVFICVLGPTTLESDWVRQEVALAVRYRKPMIPVMLERFVETVEHQQFRPARELLRYDGVRILDQQNLYVNEALKRIVQRVRPALGTPPMEV